MSKKTSKWLTYILCLCEIICIGYIIYIIYKEIGFIQTCVVCLINYSGYKLGMWYKDYIGWYTKSFDSILWFPIMIYFLVLIGFVIPISLTLK